MSRKALVIGKFFKKWALPLSLEFSSKALQLNLQVLMLVPHAHRQRQLCHKRCLAKRDGKRLSNSKMHSDIRDAKIVKNDVHPRVNELLFSLRF